LFPNSLGPLFAWVVVIGGYWSSDILDGRVYIWLTSQGTHFHQIYHNNIDPKLARVEILEGKAYISKNGN
jgi:hypothetical protein